MERKHRIILLIDFSKFTKNLLSFAFDLSDIINAKLIFVHKVPGMAPAMADREVRNEIIKSETEEAQQNLRNLAKGRGHSDDFLQVSPKPILTILKDLENELYFDWVIAGLKDSGILKRLFIGSTTLSIIDESDLLTIAVPSQNPISVPNKLIVGVNPKYPLNKFQFDTILSALKEQIKDLEFFTVLKEDEDETEAKDHLQGLQTEYAIFQPRIQLYNGEDAFSLLKSRLGLSKNSFLILQQGSRSITDKLFRKFMINELVYSGQIPLIVLSG